MTYFPPDSLDFNFYRDYPEPDGANLEFRLYNTWESEWSTPWKFNIGLASGQEFLPDPVNILISLGEAYVEESQEFLPAPVNIIVSLGEAYVKKLNFGDLPGFIRSNLSDVTGNLETYITGQLPYVDLNVQITTYALFVLTQMCTKDNYTYAATNEGLVVYDNTSTLRIATRDVEGNLPKYLYCSDTFLYIGTENGLYYVVLEEFINDFDGCIIHRSYITLSNDIRHIHGSGEELLITTASGVEYFSFSKNQNIISRTPRVGVEKSFLANKKGYYITRDSVAEDTKYSLNRVDSMLWGWSEPSYTYNTDGSIFKENLQLTDMYITEETAANGGNTIFCTTTSGIYVIDEDTLNYALYRTR